MQLACNDTSPRDAAAKHSLLFLAEQAKAKTELNRIDAWVRGCQSGVGNVHVTDLRADVVLVAQKVQSHGASAREIDARSTRRNFHIREQCAAADLKVRNNTASRIQRPFESERVDAGAVRSIRLLNDQKNWHGLDRILQSAAQKAGAVGRGENQAITQAYIPNAVAGLAAIRTVASAGPNLKFMTAFHGPCLGVSRRRAQESCKEH